MWIAVLFVLVALIVFVLLSQIHFQLKFEKCNEQENVFLLVHALFGLLRFRYELPQIVLKTWKQKINKHSFTFIPSLLESIRLFYKSFKKALRKTHVTQLEWITNVGLEDVTHTAFASSFLWNCKCIFIGKLSYSTQFATHPLLEVHPIWNNTYDIQTRLQCRARIRVGTFFWCAFSFLIVIFRMKDGKKIWKRLVWMAGQRRQ